MARRVALSLILIAIILTQNNYATICPGACITETPAGQGLVYPGNCEVLTIDGCSRSSMEYGEAHYYAFYDEVPCYCLGCAVWNGCEIGSNNCDESKYTITKGELFLQGDVEKYGIYLWLGSEEAGTCTGKGPHTVWPLQDVFAPTSILDTSEEGEIGFTFSVIARENAYKTLPDGSCILDSIDNELPLFVTNGSFRIIKNTRVSLDLFNLLFDASSSLQGMAYIESILYKHLEEPFTHQYISGNRECVDGSMRCNEVAETKIWGLTGPYYRDTTARRFKLPAWEKDVWVLDSLLGEHGDGGGQLPSYMMEDGWGIDSNDNRIWLDLGSFGKLYFVMGTPSRNDGLSSSILLDTITYCPEGEILSKIRPKWRFKYRYNDDHEARIAYIYDGNDPDYPENSSRYYKYQWSEDQKTVTQEYFNAAVSTSSPLRVETASFDDQSRVVQFSAGCASGCSGSGQGYNHVEYYDEFDGYEDLVKNKYNRNGDIVSHNQYEVLPAGYDLPEYNISVVNPGFESQVVSDGESIGGAPFWWIKTGGADDSIRTMNPSASQWSERYDEGQEIPEGQQVLSLLGGSIQTRPLGFVVAQTTYILEAETGALDDPNTSWASIKLLAYNPMDANELPAELVAIDVSENIDPEGFGTRLIQGQWVTQSGLWSYAQDPSMQGRLLRIEIAGNGVDMDQVRLTAITHIGGDTRPLLVSQQSDPNQPGEPNMLRVTWEYDSDHATAVERRWVDNETARIIKYQYADNSFAVVQSKTEFENLNENPDQPTGRTYTTLYDAVEEQQEEDTVYVKTTTYPSGKRKDIEKTYTSSGLKETYTVGTNPAVLVNHDRATYVNHKITTQTDARGAVTEYTYNIMGLLESITYPSTSAEQKMVSYEYDGARRITKEWQDNPSKRKILTQYYYDDPNSAEDPNHFYDLHTGHLMKVVYDDDYMEGFNLIVGSKQTTEYRYNDFGQVTREISPNGSKTGKKYGLGGELVSEFVIAPQEDISLPDEQLTVLSQTNYYYDDDGRIEYIKKADHPDEFQFADPMNLPSTIKWIVTRYVYDYLGRKNAVIEDEGGLSLLTQYEYNNQGEVDKTILPNGKWTEIHRNGRGQVITQIVGHDQVNSSLWQVTEYEYDANGNLLRQVDPTGAVTVYAYDDYDRLMGTKKGTNVQ